MQIGGFQKLTLLDYPGKVACIVFTRGCNFRCPFCHNAPLVWPEAAAAGESETDVLAYLRQRRGILEGVVVTGGEPLMQPGLADFLGRVRALGYPVKLDTNGSFPERLQQLLAGGLLDYVALDVKQAPDRYSTACGLPGTLAARRVAESHRILCEASIPFERRTTLVKGIHTRADVEALARWIAGPQPYYLQSYADSGQVLAPDGLAAFSPQELEEMLQTARAFCPAAALRT